MVELDMEHVLIFAIVAFMLYHLSGCRCFDNGFSVDRVAAVGKGERCAAGFCENPSDCPHCADGLTCNIPRGMMCAGTCYGTCGSAKD